jgi:phenylalanine-4-hydroxylase
MITLARVYWFSIPFRAITLTSQLYATGVVIASV